MVSTETLAAGFFAGLCGGVLTVTVAVQFFWSKLMANRSDWEETKADLKNAVHETELVDIRCSGLDRRIRDLEHPPFKPKFGDMVMAERVDKSGMWPAVYLFTRDRLHRVVVRKEGGEVVEYFADEIGPLE